MKRIAAFVFVLRNDDGASHMTSRDASALQLFEARSTAVVARKV